MELVLPNTAVPSDPNATLRLFCLLEAFTLLALVLVAVPLKHLAGVPQAVSVMGPVHGVAFLAFCWRLVQAVTAREVDGATAWRLLLGAVVPFGGIYSWVALGRKAPR